MNQMIIKIAVLLFFIMFIYSGFGKITSFQKKTKGLSKKTGFPYPINELGMIGVILLEIIGSIIIVSYFLDKEKTQKYITKQYIRYICLLFIAFMIVVTPLYHPPHKQIIAFLSNVTITSGLLLIYNMI
jgi:uncharacterized membrane protein YphA (DoxX/SURF4 family)